MSAGKNVDKSAVRWYQALQMNKNNKQSNL